MSRLDHPFEVEYDAAGHNIVAIRFDTPIMWGEWERYDYGDGIAAVLRRMNWDALAQEEREP